MKQQHIQEAVGRPNSERASPSLPQTCTVSEAIMGASTRDVLFCILPHPLGAGSTASGTNSLGVTLPLVSYGTSNEMLPLPASGPLPYRAAVTTKIVRTHQDGLGNCGSFPLLLSFSLSGDMNQPRAVHAQRTLACPGRRPRTPSFLRRLHSQEHFTEQLCGGSPRG